MSHVPRAILHIDADAFFASCEQALHPEYRGRPVITGKERGIVAAASYEARARGVTRGVSLWEVKKLCPDAIILPSDYETYSLFSLRMFEIMRRFTPCVEEYSIDEAFCDITGFRRAYHASYEEIARRMKHAIELQLGITVSVGLSVSKVLAKVASKWKKPAGFTVISPRTIEHYLRALPLEKVWGIGPQTTAYCAAHGMTTALQFVQKSEDFIRDHFSKPHHEIWMELNGQAVYPIVTEPKDTYATISKTKTFTPPSENRAYVYSQILKNLENACIKARRHRLVAGGIAAFLKTQEFQTCGLEVRLNRASAYTHEIAAVLETLFKKVYRAGVLYRATGVRLFGLNPASTAQLSLFEAPLAIERFERLYKSLDELATRFGKHTLHFGAGMQAHAKTPHAASRGEVPLRKTARLKGETARRHLRLPLL